MSSLIQGVYLDKIVFEPQVSLLTQRLLSQVFPLSLYIYGYPSDTLFRDVIVTARCITVCCIASLALKKVTSLAMIR